MRVLRDRDLSLDFPKAQKGRVRTVLDCLAHFTHKETVEMRCEKCGKLCDFEKRLRVKRRPPVLVRTPTTVISSPTACRLGQEAEFAHDSETIVVVD